MRVDFDVEIRVDTAVDLVRFFTELHESGRGDYWRLDIEQWGFDEEWERPVAYVMAWLDDDISVAEAAGKGVVRSWVDTDWRSVRWVEKQFDQLVAAVPWLHRAEPLSDEELARIPGPNDVPLFPKAVAQ
jgi:hypothetical protein